MNVMECNKCPVLNIQNKINKKEWHDATKPYFFVRRPVFLSSSTVRMKKPVLGIRDIVVLIRIRGSVPLTNGSGSNSFLQVTFKDAPTNFLQIFLIIPAGTLSSALFQSAKHLYEKREGAGSGCVPLPNGSRSGRP
jgi:hypothetical protein